MAELLRGGWRVMKFSDGAGGYEWREVWLPNAITGCATCLDLGELEGGDKCGACNGQTPKYCRNRDGKSWLERRPT